MPVVQLTEEQVLPERSNYDLEIERDPTFGELTKAYFENENPIAAIGQSFAHTNAEPDPDYDVFTDIDGYETFADRFIGVESRIDADWIKGRINKEMENKEIMSAGGLEGVAAGLLTGLVDPTMMIPIGGSAYKTYRTGGRILEGAGRTALMTGMVQSGNEIVLQSLQETRTAEESGYNIAGATFLGGIIGGAAGAFSPKQLESLGKAVEDELVVPTFGGSTVGAASLATTLEQQGLKSTLGLKSMRQKAVSYLNDKNAPDRLVAMAEAVIKDPDEFLAFQDPVLRTLNSPSVATRRLSEQLAETALTRNKNSEGIASEISVENLIKSYNLPKYEFYNDLDSLFKQHRQAQTKIVPQMQDMAASTFKRSRKDGKLTYNEFGEEVIKAARRNDTHEIPEVAQAAKALRSKVFDPIFARAKEVGLIEEGVEAPKTAPSYATRIWDTGRIKNNEAEFVQRNADWLRQKRDASARELDQVKADNAKKMADIEAKRAEKKELSEPDKKLLQQIDELEYRAAQTDEELRNVAWQLMDRINGTAVGRLPYDNKLPTGRSSNSVGKRGPAKERVYDIPDELVEDFLVNDINAVVESYVRSLASDIELKAKFGSIDPEDTMKQIQDDYHILREGKTPEEQRKLTKQMNSDLADFKGMWERLRGTYGNMGGDDYASLPKSAERIAMNANYLAMLGGMTISAFSDVARPVMIHGLKNVAGDGFRAMATNWKGFKAAASEIKEAGTALDMALGTRAKAMAGMDEYQPFTNRLEAVTGKMANGFGVLSLMAPWNTGWKQFTGVVAQSRLVKLSTTLSEGGSLSKGDTEFLAANFIDKKMAKRIAKMFDEHGEKGDALIPNVRNWTDADAQRTFRAAIRRDVDRTIVTPGQDKPFLMSKSGWKLMMQFRSFALASTQRTLLAGLQQRDAAVLNGAILTTALGMMTYIVKTQAAGKEPSYDLDKLLVEGVDRGGLTGWLMDANNVVEKVSRGRLGVNAMLGGPAMSRYASRSAMEAVFGPTYGMIGNVTQVAGNGLAGDWKESDTHTIRRMMPYQNLFYIRSLLDEAEGNINEFFGFTK